MNKIYVALLCCLASLCWGTPKAEFSDIEQKKAKMILTAVQPGSIMFSEAVSALTFADDDMNFPYDYFESLLQKNHFNEDFYACMAYLVTHEPAYAARVIESQSDALLEQADLHKLFSILGYGSVSQFYDLKSLIDSIPPNPGSSPFKAYSAAVLYAETGDDFYKDYLQFHVSENLGPEEIGELKEIYKENEIPAQRLDWILKKNGAVYEIGLPGINYWPRFSINNGSFNLENILNQAELYRQSITDEVYAIQGEVNFMEASYEQEGEELVIRNHPETLSLGYDKLIFSPYLQLLDSLAYLYAGEEDQEKNNFIQEEFSAFSESVKEEMVMVFIQADETESLENLVASLFETADDADRSILLSFYIQKETPLPPGVIEYLHKALESSDYTNQVLAASLIVRL